jgi:hypothetical protein
MFLPANANKNWLNTIMLTVYLVNLNYQYENSCLKMKVYWLAASALLTEGDDILVIFP